MAYDPPSPPSGPIDPSRIGRLSTPLTGEALERRRRLAAFNDAQVVTIADAGHNVQHDQPDEVARVLEEFLARD